MKLMDECCETRRTRARDSRRTTQSKLRTTTIEAPNHNNADNETEAVRIASSRRDERDRVSELLHSILYGRRDSNRRNAKEDEKRRGRQSNYFPLLSIVSLRVALWLAEIDRQRWDEAKVARVVDEAVLFDTSGAVSSRIMNVRRLWCVRCFEGEVSEGPEMSVNVLLGYVIVAFYGDFRLPRLMT